jgi:hypothetical protein
VGAQVDLANAQGRLDRAQQELDAAQADVDYWEEEVEAARRDQCVQCSKEEQERAQERLDDAQKQRDEAQKQRDEAQKQRDEAQKQRDEAAKKAAEAKKKVEELKKQEAQDGLEPTPFNSAACNRLIGNGVDFMDPVDMKKLPENWTDMQAKLDRVSHPNPDDPVDSDGSASFGLPSCGPDANTNHGVSDCSSLTMCTESGAQCNCNLDADAAEEQARKAASKAEQFACVTTTCPDGTTPMPDGLYCACNSNPNGSSGGEPPRPRPLPIAEVFMTIEAMPVEQIHQEQDLLSAIASDLFRDH